MSSFDGARLLTRYFRHGCGFGDGASIEVYFYGASMSRRTFLSKTVHIIYYHKGACGYGTGRRLLESNHLHSHSPIRKPFTS